jgi:hypothetical protein
MPVTGFDLPQGDNGKTARGIVITGLQSTDESPFNAVFSAPSTDGSVPEQPSDGTFPASIHNLTTTDTSHGPEQRAMFMPAQFIPDPSATPGTGTERRYTMLTGFVPYSNSPDVTPPTILETHAANVGDVVTFLARVEDDVPDNVARVLVVYKPEQSDTWGVLDLVHEPATDRWTSSTPLTGTVQYTVYALDGAGNVGLSTNKGEFHQTISTGIPSGLSLSVSGTQGDSGWYYDASVSVSGEPGVQFTISVDGGAAQPYSGPVPIVGTGIHTISAEGSDGSSGSTQVSLDDVGPTANVTSPADGATYLKGEPVPAQYFCLDAGSGPASCSGPVANGANIDTSASGPHTFQVDAPDNAGNSGGGSVSYTVSTQCYQNLSCDGIPDSYKQAQACFAQYLPTQDIANLDTDNDGLTNAGEYQAGADPCVSDTDSDTLLDGAEVNVYHTDPTVADTDTDGCGDAKELTLAPPTDPADPWDFYNVPVPALLAAQNPQSAVRDRLVSPGDAQAVFAYSKAGAKMGTTVYDQDLDHNGVKDGIQYDRTMLGVGRSGPPDGIVAASDAQIAFAQVKHSYRC